MNAIRDIIGASIISVGAHIMTKRGRKVVVHTILRGMIEHGKEPVAEQVRRA